MLDDIGGDMYAENYLGQDPQIIYRPGDRRNPRDVREQTWFQKEQISRVAYGDCLIDCLFVRGWLLRYHPGKRIYTFGSRFLVSLSGSLWKLLAYFNQCFHALF